MTHVANRLVGGLTSVVVLMAFVHCACAGDAAAAGERPPLGGQHGCGHHPPHGPESPEPDSHEHHPGCQHCHEVLLVKPAAGTSIGPLELHPQQAVLPPGQGMVAVSGPPAHHTYLLADIRPPPGGRALLSLNCTLLI